MSTDYYGFRKPITSIRAEVMGGHTHVGIWVNHAKSGTLVFRNEEWKEAIWLFVNEGETVMRTYYGGKGVGTVVVEDIEGQESDRLLVSERGEIVSVAEVRSREGGGK